MIKLFRDTDIGGSLSGGPDPIPEDVRKKIEERFYILTEDAFDDSFISYWDYVKERRGLRKAATWAYKTLSLPTIQAKEERIRVLEEALKEIRDRGYTGAYMIAHEALIKSKALTLNL